MNTSVYPGVFPGTSIVLIAVYLFAASHAHATLANNAETENTDLASIPTITAHPIAGIPFQQTRALDDLYFLAPMRLLWSDRTDLVNRIISLLMTAPEHGLVSTDYTSSAFQSQWQSLQNRTEKADAAALSVFDRELSKRLLHFLCDVGWGRNVPQRMRTGSPRSPDYERLIHAMIEASMTGRINDLIRKIEPDIPAYEILKERLKQFRAKFSTSIHKTVLINHSINPGDIHEEIPLIRTVLASLALAHPLSPHTEAQFSPEFYDQTLVHTIKQFQHLHGLTEDGIIGRKTVAALNIPLSQRILQLELAMERLRWLPRHNTGENLILVNIPAFRLWAVKQKNWPDLQDFSMKVIVGIAKKEQTPQFSARLKYLVFRPYWNVPDSIAFKEIIPQLNENPDTLARLNMELVPSFHDNVRALESTEENLQMFRQGVLKVRQRPGHNNALGQVKFIFPNRFAIYLHDTPAKSLFKAERRDFSHGCIRVEHPQNLAEHILQSENHQWGRDEIRQAMQTGYNQWIQLKGTFNVVIFYSTVQAIGDNLYFFDDIYGHDLRLSQALGKAATLSSLAQSGQNIQYIYILNP